MLSRCIGYRRRSLEEGSEVPRKKTTLSVLRTEALTPHMHRVYLGGANFDDFDAIDETDATSSCSSGPMTNRSCARTPFARSTPARGRSPSTSWCTATRESRGRGPPGRSRGDEMSFFGPSGGYAPRPDADWHLFAGDESAIPAIAAAVEALPEDAVAKVFIEVADRHDEIYMETLAVVDVTWVHRGASSNEVGDDRAGDNAPLIAAVKETEWLPGQAQVFVHGEAQAVMHNIRPYIRKERGVGAEWASISGYWRRGRTEETFRVWKRELAQAESGVDA